MAIERGCARGGGLLLITEVVLAVSLSLNLVLSHTLAEARRPTTAAIEGKVLHPLNLVSVSGEPYLHSYDQRQLPTILYYFSPACGWCERNWSNVRALAEQTARKYRFIALTTADDVQEFVRRRSLGVEVYTGLRASDVEAYGLRGTPQTIVLSPTGRALVAWRGAYNDGLRTRIERYLRVRLPGLDTAPVR
jgi:hypothetical protein